MRIHASVWRLSISLFIHQTIHSSIHPSIHVCVDSSTCFLNSGMRKRQPLFAFRWQTALFTDLVGKDVESLVLLFNSPHHSHRVGLSEICQGNSGHFRKQLHVIIQILFWLGHMVLGLILRGRGDCAVSEWREVNVSARGAMERVIGGRHSWIQPSLRAVWRGYLTSWSLSSPICEMRITVSSLAE